MCNLAQTTTRPACSGCKVKAATVLREVANEPATRLAMLQEQRPNDVYTHGEAVAACEELITYFSTI
jgi:hypothetical protein